MTKKDIHIVLSSSKEFLPYCCTTMISILENLSEDSFAHFYIISFDIDEKSKKKVEKIKKIRDCSIEYPKFDESKLDLFDGIKLPPHVNKMTYTRVLIPDILPKVDKAIFIDSDTLVLQDLTTLYDIDLEDCYLGAVEDVDYLNLSKILFGKEELYFNGGVLLLDLRKLREINYKEILSKAIEEKRKKYLICDQSVLNHSFRGKIKNLSCRFNLYHYWHFNFARYIPTHEEDYKISLNNPVVIHFVGPDKPWYLASKHPYKNEYLKYYKLNPFKKLKLISIDKYRLRHEECIDIKFINILFFSYRKLFDEKNNSTLTKANLLGCRIFKNINEPLKKVFYILGVSIFKKKKINNKKCYFLLGLPFLRFDYFGRNKKIALFGIKLYNEVSQKLDMIRNDLLNEMHTQFNDIKELNYQAMWYTQKVAKLHSEVFPQYKKKHMGQDFAIVGCGPSLNYYKPIKNCIHMALNRAFTIDKKLFDYIFLWDFPGMKNADDGEEIVNQYLNYDAIKFAGCFLNDNILNVEDIINKRGTLHRCYSSARYGLSISTIDKIIHPDISIHPLADFMSVSFGALHFALYTHPAKIYLVGCDTSTGAFNKRNDPKDFKTIFLGYKLFKKFITQHYPDIEVISVNPVGLKGMFKDVYTEEYLLEHPEINRNDVEILNV